MDGMASRSVPPAKFPMPTKPWSIRNGRLRQMTSSPSIIGRSPLRPHRCLRALAVMSPGMAVRRSTQPITAAMLTQRTR